MYPKLKYYGEFRVLQRLRIAIVFSMYEKSFFTRSNDVPTRYSLSGKLREKAQSSGLETISNKIRFSKRFCLGETFLFSLFQRRMSTWNSKCRKVTGKRISFVSTMMLGSLSKQMLRLYIDRATQKSDHTEEAPAVT